MLTVKLHGQYTFNDHVPVLALNWAIYYYESVKLICQRERLPGQKPGQKI